MKKLLVFLWLFVSGFVLISQEGLPFVRVFKQSDYGGGTQIWSVVQDDKGIMYFGGNENLLIYDGTQWSKLPMHTVRSLAKTADGTIFVGSIGDFGYLSSSDKGRLKFVSLAKNLDSINGMFTNVWSISTDGKNVYFCAEEALFRYNKDLKPQLKAIGDTQWRYFLTYDVNHKVYAYVRGKGLFRIHNDSFEPLNTDKALVPFALLPYDDKLLSVTPQGLWVIDEAADTVPAITKSYFDPEAIRILDSFLIENQPYIGAVYLGDGKYALSTIRAGIVIIDKKARIIEVIGKQEGLLSPTVHYLYKDNENQLWAGCSYGIAYVQYDSPYRFFDERLGFQGVIYDVFEDKNIFYLTSNLGIFYRLQNKFYPIPELTGRNALQVFLPTKIKIPDSKRSFTVVNTVRNMFLLDSLQVKPINNITASSIYQSRLDSQTVWITENYALYKASVSDFLSHPKEIYRFSFMPLVMGQKSKDELWMLKDGKIFSFNTASKVVDFYEKNLPEHLKFYGCVDDDGKCLFLTSEGFWSFTDKSGFEKKKGFWGGFLDFKQVIAFQRVKNYAFALYKEGEQSRTKLAVISKKEGRFEIDTLLGKPLNDFENFYLRGDSLLYLISPLEVYICNIKAKRDYKTVNNLVIRRIETEDSVIFAGYDFGKVSENLVFDYSHNDLTFYYSLPTFLVTQKTEYSYLLEGGKRQQWSQWTTANYKDFSNLHEGKYVLKIKARNIYGQETKVEEIRFEILPPFYRTIYAYVFYVIVAVFLIFLIVKLYSLRLKRENERLERIVAERTAEINQQKEELKVQSEHLFEMNKELRAKNLYIIESINYAQRIQRVMLPSKEDFKKHFEEFFIFYSPKDIISGDFYWIKSFGDKVMLIGADATGHGVPGGFISILGISFLHEITRKDEVLLPSEILEKMRFYIKSALHQNDSDFVKNYDGIDMAVLLFDKENNEMIFAGADFPLFMVNNGMIYTYKPVLCPLGFHIVEKKFHDQTLTLHKGDMIYLMSDGFKDQLNDKNEKMTVTRVKKFLLSIHKEPVEVQKAKIREFFENWKGSKSQTDDVMIIGIRW